MTFEKELSVGKPNSLGNTEKVVRKVLRNPKLLPNLFDTLNSQDEWVRMRAGDAIEKVFRERPGLAKGYEQKVLGFMAGIDQPSVQWHVAEIVSEIDLTPAQHQKALEILKNNLKQSSDWIVLNVTMQVLSDFSKGDLGLQRWLKPQLKRLMVDSRRSVAKRAAKLADTLSK